MRYTIALLAVGLLGVAPAARGQGGTDMVLFDAPRGTWLATVKENAAVTVLEERDGWRRVRLEGWTMAPGVARADGATPPTPDQPAAPPAAPPAATSGARVQGVLAPDIRSGGPPGANLLVLLVRQSETLLADHRRAGQECMTRVADKDRDIEGLRSGLERSLNSSDNFREAATRNDETRKRLKAAESDRQQIVQECRARAQAIFEGAAVQRALSNAGGRFEFANVGSGRYGVVALEAGSDKARSWSFDFLIEGTESRVLDPTVDRAGFEADWGLR